MSENIIPNGTIVEITTDAFNDIVDDEGNTSYYAKGTRHTIIDYIDDRLTDILFGSPMYNVSNDLGITGFLARDEFDVVE